MSIFVTILTPFLFILTFLLQICLHLVGDLGMGIVLLSFFVSIAAYPLVSIGYRIADRVKNKQLAMVDEIASARSTLKGEARFHKIEDIYRQHSYSPISAVGHSAPFLFQLPILIAVLIFLTDLPQEFGNGPFFAIDSLRSPDELIAIPNFPMLRFNLLPILIVIVSMCEGMVRFSGDINGLVRHGFVCIIVLILIYNMPTAACLYWLVSTLVSFAASLYSIAVGFRRNLNT